MSENVHQELLDLRNTLCGAARYEQDSRDRRRGVWIAIACLVVILAALAVGIAQVLHTVTDIEKRQGTVVRCLSEQLREHRLDSRYHNEQEAELGGYPYPPSQGAVPPPHAPSSPKACEGVNE